MAYITLKQAAQHDDKCRVICGNHTCNHEGIMYFAPLIERHGEDNSLGPILEKMRCKVCAHRGAAVRSTSYDPDRPWRPLYDPVTGKRL